MGSDWSSLESHASQMKSSSLRDLMADKERCEKMITKLESEQGPLFLDYSRQLASAETMDKLKTLAQETGVFEKIEKMFKGEKINETEGRAVLHTALRARKDDEEVLVDGQNVLPSVHEILDRISVFAEKVRSGEWKGYTGKSLTSVVCVGIGGSYLGPEFVFEAMSTWPEAAKEAEGRRMKFLANVDPIDVTRALRDLDPETTLVIVLSKTFTTAETMLNARTVKQWLVNHFNDEKCVGKHVVAVSTALEKTREFGIEEENVFGFWDWVGGRFSVCSAVGVLPLALQYGMPQVRQFLEGARFMDKHFREAEFEQNVPMLMGMTAVWNSTFLGFESHAVLPYCQALVRFVAHVQQLDMESNGKRVTMEEEPKEVTFPTGQVIFGEPGTNGQHSFYQLLHQGRATSADFIGFARSQTPKTLPPSEHPVSSHDELMSNFFAQPDALAFGKTVQECEEEGVPEALRLHKEFPGNRPSLSLLLPECSPFWVGALLSIYEHRTAVQSWVWNTNAFDQWGVELGKVLAKNVRTYLASGKGGEKFPSSTQTLLKEYVSQRQ